MNFRKLFISIILCLFYFTFINNQCCSYIILTPAELAFDQKDVIAVIYSKKFVEDTKSNHQFYLKIIVNNLNSDVYFCKVLTNTTVCLPIVIIK